MPAKQWYPLRETAAFADGYDCKGASPARFPVDREVFRIGLDQIGVPCIFRDAKTVVALLPLGGLSEDMSLQLTLA